MAKEYTFKVNGTEFSTDQQYLTANEILDLAKEKGEIPGDPKVYILKGDKGDYRGSDKIDLAEDNLFLTVPDTSTPVA